MVISIIVLLVVLGIMVYYIVAKSYDFIDRILTGGIFIILETLLLGICVFINAFVSEVMPESEMTIEKTGEQEIIALKDNMKINGGMYIFSGYVNEDLYYYYAEKTEYGYKTNNVRASECYIVYTDKQPKIETYSATKLNHWYYYIFAMPMKTYYVIYVPEGTVTTEFNIDLEA